MSWLWSEWASALPIPSDKLGGPFIMMWKAKSAEDNGALSTSPSQPLTSLTRNTMFSHIEKPQALIGLTQSIFQTYNPTWPDCKQLLWMLFNTAEHWRVIQAALCWLENNAPEGVTNVQAYAQGQFPETDPSWDPNVEAQLQHLQKYREALLQGLREGRKKSNNYYKDFRNTPWNWWKS